jgi:Lon-like ATP-dependent protease
LDKEELEVVARNAVDKIHMTAEEAGISLLASYTRNGREVVNMMQIAAGLAITEDRYEVKLEDIEWVIHSSQLAPKYENKIKEKAQLGLVNGLAVFGPNSGALLEIEVTAIPTEPKKGTLNITGIVEEESLGGQSGKSVRRKSMAKGSVENVITVLRSLGVPAADFDIHVNFPGGVPIDGPSAGIAMATGIYSAIFKLPVSNLIAMTGEISIHGTVKPIGGVIPKIKAAKQAGAKRVIIPAENMQSIIKEIEGIEVIPVHRFQEVLDLALVREKATDTIIENIIQVPIAVPKTESM